SSRRISDLWSQWNFETETSDPSVRQIFLELLPELAPLIAHYRDAKSDWPAEALMEHVQRSVFLSDWTRFDTALRESLVEAFLGNGKTYRLAQPPQRPATYYAGELDHVVEALRAHEGEASLDSTELITAIQAIAILDDDWNVEPKWKEFTIWD